MATIVRNTIAENFQSPKQPKHGKNDQKSQYKSIETYREIK